MVKQLIIRMNYNSLLKIQKVFPAYPDEKMASYFKRLAAYLTTLKGGSASK